MNVIVFDLEATCWAEHDNVSRDESEIIEIGAVKINSENFDVIDTFDIFIKPERHPILSDYCKRLTNIEQKDVDSGKSFPESMDLFNEWCSDSSLFVSWGDYDRRQIIRESNSKYYTGKIVNRITNHINIKHRIGQVSGHQHLGLDKAGRIFDIKFEGVPHRGITDSINIVKVMKYFKEKLVEFNEFAG